MLLREALANSYNVPAVDALQFIGVDGLLEISTRLGVESLVHPETGCPDYPYEQPPSYGLALTLGGGEAKLLEMAGAFAVFANNGVRVSSSPILRIEDSRGNVLLDNTTPDGEQVIRPQHVYLMTSILSDEDARCMEFGCPNVLELSRPAAAKTGTTNDYRDAWTIGYTPDLVTGVWVGNSDNSEMVSLPGSAGAGPIWHSFMEAAHEGLPVRNFIRPDGIMDLEICADSGARSSEYCSSRRVEVFAEDQPPLDADQGWYRNVEIDEWTGLLANDYCLDSVVEKVLVVIEDPQGREWAQAHPEYFGGIPLAPLEQCTEGTSRPVVVITSPAQDGTVQGVVPVVGTVQLPDFDRYEVQYGQGADPHDWQWLSGPHLTQVRDGTLTEWDTQGLAAGVYTLRVRAFDKNGHQTDGFVHAFVQGPTETPTSAATATFTATMMPSPTSTASPSPTLAPTFTLEPSPTASNTPAVQTPTSTSTPDLTPTFTPTLEPTVTVEITTSVSISVTSTITSSQ
jgi:membrane peptidoglycan carboxypeptidase